MTLCFSPLRFDRFQYNARFIEKHVQKNNAAWPQVRAIMGDRISEEDIEQLLPCELAIGDAFSASVRTRDGEIALNCEGTALKISQNNYEIFCLFRSPSATPSPHRCTPASTTCSFI